MGLAGAGLHRERNVPDEHNHQDGVTAVLPLPAGARTGRSHVLQATSVWNLDYRTGGESKSIACRWRRPVVALHRPGVRQI